MKGDGFVLGGDFTPDEGCGFLEFCREQDEKQKEQSAKHKKGYNGEGR